MLFPARFTAGIVDGSITVSFRRWKRRQAIAGHRYRTIAGIIEVDAVDVVTTAEITATDARRAGYPSPNELVADLRGEPGMPITRVRFHHVDEPDPRDVLARTADLTDADVAELDRRLERLDRASRSGPWTMAVLDAIRQHPERRAADLAEGFGREKEPFKLDVRKLTNLGLTVSLERGYRLSPRGEAYLGRTARRS